jgi:DNA-binding transcriptional LysR family regulator
MAMVFAVAPRHPLESADEPLLLRQLRQHRQVVVGDTSRRLAPRDVGLVGASDVLTVPSTQAKVQAQITGLGVGFVPESRARAAIKREALVVKATEGVSPKGQG